MAKEPERPDEQSFLFINNKYCRYWQLNRRDGMDKKLSILFAGESCMVHHIEYKGYDSFYGTTYNESVVIMKELFDKLGHKFTHIPCHMVPRAFPRKLEELKRYDVVLFSDVGSNTFLLLPDMVKTGVRSPNLLKLVKEYVEQGGGFGMIGGYMSFQGIEAKAKYKDSHIEDILPVNLLTYDDRVEIPEGADLVCNSDSHPILKGMPDKWPYILGYNRLIAKPEAQVLVSYEQDPIITVGFYGKGRTLAYATDCAPHWAPAAMYKWEGYPILWDRLVHWLAKKI